MNILITVGTTAFDRLIKTADEQLYQSYQITGQISDGRYKPKNYPYFRFSDDIKEYYKKAELVISHGGAGSIYKLLEMGKKLIIVPNLDRIDDHQQDICEYMMKNNHAAVCYQLDQLLKVVNEAVNSQFAIYQADEFTGIDPIRDYLGLNT